MKLTDDDKLKLDKVAANLLKAAVHEAKADDLTEKARETLWGFADEHFEASELLERKHVTVATNDELVAAHRAERDNPAFIVESVEDTSDQTDEPSFTVFMKENPKLKKFVYSTDDGVKIGRTVGADPKRPEHFDVKGFVRDHPDMAAEFVTVVETKRWRPGKQDPDVETTVEIEAGNLEAFLSANPDERDVLVPYIVPGGLKTKWMPKPKPPKKDKK